jgi:imidazolonepropionase-like amidohydrolase
MYPGDSLHHELVELVSAGLSPLQALKAASIDAARWFDLDYESGSIEVAKWADMVILAENPLEDIRNTRSLVAVVQFGNFYDREELMQLRKLPRNE